jgi:hypothetical protein
MRQHHRGSGDAAAASLGGDVHDQPEIQVLVIEPGNKAAGRFADDGEYPDAVGGADPG